MALCQRAHLHGVINYIGRLNQVLLAEFAEDGVDQFALAHRRGNLHAEFLTGGAKIGLGHSLYVYSCILLDSIKDREAAVRSGKIDCVTGNLYLGSSVDLEGDLLEHLLHELHHPDVVLVSYVDLHAGELRVMGLVHTLVAEVLRELIHSVVAAYDKPLKVKLVGDTKIKRNVKRIVMGNERAGRSSSGDALEDRGLNLEAACLVEVLAHSSDNLSPLDEGLLHLRVHDKVYVALAVAKLGIGEGIEHLAVHLLDYRKNAKRLRKKS